MTSLISLSVPKPNVKEQSTKLDTNTFINVPINHEYYCLEENISKVKVLKVEHNTREVRSVPLHAFFNFPYSTQLNVLISYFGKKEYPDAKVKILSTNLRPIKLSKDHTKLYKYKYLHRKLLKEADKVNDMIFVYQTLKLLNGKVKPINVVTLDQLAKGLIPANDAVKFLHPYTPVIVLTNSEEILNPLALRAREEASNLKKILQSAAYYPWKRM